MITLYSKSNCPTCVSAKNLLKLKNLEYVEISLDNLEEKIKFVEKYPNVRTVPFLIDVDGSIIGSFVDLQKKLL